MVTVVSVQLCGYSVMNVCVESENHGFGMDCNHGNYGVLVINAICRCVHVCGMVTLVVTVSGKGVCVYVESGTHAA